MASKSLPNGSAPDFGIIKPATGAKSKEDWIGNQLKKVYDEALSEDIPDDMLALLSALDESAAESDADSDGSAEEASE
ncbi:NepR family anti-sigma factor [Roseibium aggregatum]|uniref:Anti-sigma factor NepR domain-containing protein n=1 Tax=Roseibium aggregatum TaxID=187304 RepID=A0A939ECL9_9HYPH|nr:NepR family anti-sigma factor [Roseibium aggregatum]MBN9669415.1 hypothetical protein [Roseibium aggregatum]